jgi:uncharacterized membrane protein YjjB (DUF3815 family)
VVRTWAVDVAAKPSIANAMAAITMGFIADIIPVPR